MSAPKQIKEIIVECLDHIYKIENKGNAKNNRIHLKAITHRLHLLEHWSYGTNTIKALKKALYRNEASKN